MSQSSRSKIRARVRWRRGLTQLLADNAATRVTRVVALDLDPNSMAPTRRWVADAIANGAPFDVHAARQLGERMVAMTDEQVAFEDWTRERGLGPENRERGAFGWCPGTVVTVRVDGICEFRPCHESDDCTHDIADAGGWPGKLAREYTKAGGKPIAAMGRSLARQGQRLLDALAGQPSRCQSGCFGLKWNADAHDWHIVEGGGWLRESSGNAFAECSDCHGTGHNLRGVLPPLEWSAQVRRKVADGEAMPLDAPGDWTEIIADTVAAWRGTTRTVPRGEHREGVGVGSLDWMPHDSPRANVIRLSGPAQELEHGFSAPKTVTIRHLAPRWRRGELRHAEQRREADRSD